MSVPTLYGISAETDRGLSLYDIETDLLSLIEIQEAIAYSPREYAPDALEAVEKHIKLRLQDLVAKVDGAAFYIREFKARAAAAKAEKDRNRDREKLYESRQERLEAYIVSVMQMMGKKRLEGDSNTLRLQKCPDSVEVVQPELVPAEYTTVTLTIPQTLWDMIGTALFKFHPEIVEKMQYDPKVKLEHKLTPIKEALKQQIDCDRCKGKGTVVPFGSQTDRVKCEVCNGTGKVNQGVPGCVLVTDKMSLRVE